MIESPASLVSRVLRHYVFQILSQLLRIVGSLASIGSPVNLVRKAVPSYQKTQLGFGVPHMK